MSGYAMNYLALVARDLESACRFLGDSLGLQRRDVALGGRTVPFFGIGKSAIAIFETDNPYLEAPVFPGIHHMALATTDPLATALKHELPITANGKGPDGKCYVNIDPSHSRHPHPLH